MYKVFELSNKYIILATPLILFTLISSIYLTVTISGGKLLNILFAMLLFYLMTGAFFSGWFNMVKLAVSEDVFGKNPNSLIKEFLPGVGEYVLSTLGLIGITFIFLIVLSALLFIIGKTLIGNPGVSLEEISYAMKNPDTMKTFLLGLDSVQLIKINLWNLLFFFGMTAGYFLLFLFVPSLFFKNKNPFKAFIISLKDTFSKHFFKTAGIFLLIFTVNFFISLFSTALGNIVIIHFLLTLLNFYFIVLATVSIFYYYYQTFINPLIGQNINIEI